MFISMALASVAAAGALIYGVHAIALWVAGSSADSRTVVLATYIGAAVAAIPAYFVSITVGGGAGGAWAEAFGGEAAIPLGVGAGMFVVLVGMVLAASAVTAAIARFISG
jgi:hypothetical protein